MLGLLRAIAGALKNALLAALEFGWWAVTLPLRMLAPPAGESAIPGPDRAMHGELQNERETANDLLEATKRNESTGVLGDTLELSVLAEDTDGGCDDRDGAVIEPAAALDGAGYGDPAQGDDTGDRVLVAGADEDLCFVVELPDTTGNGAQGLTTDATFLFEGEQTDNNP